LRQRRKDRLIVVVLVVEQIRAACREVRAKRVFARYGGRLGDAVLLALVLVVLTLGVVFARGAAKRGLDLEGVHVDALSVGFVAGGLGRGRGSSLLALLLFPFA
jgi:hypothetical protein